MSGHNRAEHNIFGQLFGFGFNHHHRVLRTGNNQIKLGLFHVINRRVDDIFAINITNARSANRAHKRRTGQNQRSRRANHAQNVRIVFKVIRDSRQNDLHFMLEAFDEKRADRAVNEARGQRLFFSWTAFTFEEATRNAARRIIFFHIVHGQREEILTGLGFLAENSRGEHRCVTISDEDCPICLTCHTARFNRKRTAGPFQRYCVFIEHIVFFHIVRKNPLARMAQRVLRGRP